MSVLIAEHIFKSYGAQVVLEDAGIVLQPGERVGLLGINGSGKSTFAKILAGSEAPDAGEVRITKNVRVSYFAQEPEFAPGVSVRDIVAEGLGEWREAFERYDLISNQLTKGEGKVDALLAEQERLGATIERLGGWERMHQVDTALDHLGVTRVDALASELSGGEKRRVALARLLVAQPDLAILDEPTNHLDIETIEWLEEQLIAFKGALLFITHDRYMLDRVAQRIVEMDRTIMHSYRGGWDAYLEAKAERAAHEGRTEANRQNFLRRELEWLSRSPQARTTKQKARIKRVEGVRDQEGPKAQQVVSQLSVQNARTGRTIIDIRDLRLELGGKLLIDKLDLFLAKGDRIGVVGRNGVGKTSLLRAIIGQLEPVAGEIKLGETMRVGYFEQTRATLDPEQSIFENVVGNRGDVTVGAEVITPHAYLERFQFTRNRSREKVRLLSGGERARVALAKMLIDPVNLLLLDEPTNDLDVATLGALEEMLVTTEATAIVVTHDRYFLDRVATSVLAFEGEGRVVRYASAHQALQGAASKPSTNAASDQAGPNLAKSADSGAGKKPGLTYGERIELEGIMDAVAACEEAVSRAEAKLADPELYSQRGSEVPALQSELDSAQSKLSATLERWEFLESKKLDAE